jgi:tetratricopeptide (TPR) repeat protein
MHTGNRRVMGAALILLLAFPPATLHQGVHISSTLSPSSVMVGETATLAVTVQTGGQQPDSWQLPRLPVGVSIVGSSDQTQMQFSLPGGRSYSVTRSYVLVATRPGRYDLGDVVVGVASHQYRAGGLTLTVTSAPTASGGASEPSTAAPQGVTFRARMTPDTVYVGQQATLEAEARFSGDVRMRLEWAPQYVPPNPPGFWIQDLADGTFVRTRVDANRGVSELHQYQRAYFPLAPGRYHLPPALLDYNLRSGLFGQSVPQELATDSIALIVRPLPQRGRPPFFDGSVGQYKVAASLQPDHLPTGETAVLRVTVSGTGNIKALGAPRLPDIAGVQIFPPTEDAEVTDTAGMVAGHKTFTWPIVPDKPGAVAVGPVQFAYFDPDTRRYEVVYSDTLVLHATPTAVAGDTRAAPAGPGSIRSSPAGGSTLPWTRSTWFVALQFVPLLAGLGLVIRRRSAARGASRRARRGARRKELAVLRALAQSDDREFHARFPRFLVGAVAQHLGLLDVPAANPQAVEALLVRRGLPRDTAAAVRDLLAAAEQARFDPQPLDPDARLRLVDRARELLDRLDASWRSVRSTPSAAPLALVILLSGPVTATPAAPDPAFTQGVAAFRQHDVQRARVDFATYLQANPRDPNAWYDYGLAAYQLGRRGEAARAWLITLGLAPRDAEARAGLAAIGTPPDVVAAAAPLLPVSVNEWLAAASLLWLLGSALLVLRLATRRSRLTPVALGLMALAALAVMAPVSRGLGAQNAVVLHQGTPLRDAPDVRAASRARLDEATTLVVGGERPGWAQVQTADGREGWVAASDIGIW